MQRRLSAILSADIVGYSKLMGQDEAGTLTGLRDVRENILAPAVSDNRGEIIKSMGDGWFIEFRSVFEAVACARRVQETLSNDSTISMRIGIHIGDVMHENNDLYGDGVNVAARLQEIAQPGGIVISDIAERSLDDKTAGEFNNLGVFDLKNIEDRFTLFGWGMSEAAIAPIATETPDNGADKPSIGVLPFDNMSGDPEQAYFSDGLTEDIITALSKFHWMDVLARNTTFAYRGQNQNIQKLASDLNLDYVVEGSVRKAGTRIRVTAQLIDATTGSHIWAERYDRKLEDIFDLQDEITETIVGRVEPEIGTAVRRKVERRPKRDLKAWDCFHLGIANFYKFTPEGNLEAQSLLQQSRELDPSFPEAHAYWAYAVVLGMVYWDTEPDEALLEEAYEAARKAVELDSQNATLYMLLGRVNLARCEYRTALADSEMAVRLNSTLAPAYCGLGDSLAYEGRYEEAIHYFEKAVEMSPNHPQLWAFLSYGALNLIFDEEFDMALDWAQRALDIPNCQYWAAAHGVVALSHLDQDQERKKMVDRLLAAKPDFNLTFARKKLFYIKRPEQLELYLKGLEAAGIPV